MPAEVTIVISPGSRALESGDVDVIYSKSIVNEHMYRGEGLYARPERATWLRTIAWMPQEDRFLFAIAPQWEISTFEEIAAQKPPLRTAGGRVAPYLLEAYGFSYADIPSWGGYVSPMRHTADAALERYERGDLDFFTGDGSEFDFSAWRWVAQHGFRFLNIRSDIMTKLCTELGVRKIITPIGFLPGIHENLLSIDDSHIVVTVHERLDDRVAYNLARTIDERRRDIECASIQVGYGPDETLPLTRPTFWSSLTGTIGRQWDEKILGAPLHPGAERYYQEHGLL
jgi:TRAP-type uncharacterized transport system substrate-binding protein